MERLHGGVEEWVHCSLAPKNLRNSEEVLVVVPVVALVVVLEIGLSEDLAEDHPEVVGCTAPAVHMG